MNRFVRTLVFLAIGYLVGVVLGFALVYGFSGNTHDIGVEAPVTAFLLVGPVAALIGAILGFRRGTWHKIDEETS